MLDEQGGKHASCSSLIDHTESDELVSPCCFLSLSSARPAQHHEEGSSFFSSRVTMIDLNRRKSKCYSGILMIIE